MPDYTSIEAVGSSIERLLSMCFKQRPLFDEEEKTVRISLIRTEDLNLIGSNGITRPALSLFLYRVDFNKTMRASWSAISHRDGESHLPLDLHFLLTAWDDKPEYEYRILGRAMQCLENHPILSGPLLYAITNWSAHESIQICMEDLTTEDVMRTFDSLPVDYKLSVPYVARVVVIDGKESQPDAEVSAMVKGIKSGVAG